AGSPPPDAASRVGKDRYQPLAETQAGLFDATFLTAIDRGLAFAPEQRPQSIDEWSRLFGGTLARAQDALTQRMEPTPSANAPSAAPRLGGVSRESHENLPPVETRRRLLPMTPIVVLALLVVIGVGVWRYQDRLQGLMSGSPPPAAPSTPPAQASATPPSAP